MNFRERIKDANRIVIKVGTSTVTYKNGNINLERIDNLAKVISGIVNSGKEAVLLTSGAMVILALKLLILFSIIIYTALSRPQMM